MIMARKMYFIEYCQIECLRYPYHKHFVYMYYYCLGILKIRKNRHRYKQSQNDVRIL